LHTFFFHHHGHQLLLFKVLVPLKCCQSVEGLKVEKEEEEDLSSNLSEHIKIDDQSTCFEYHLGKKGFI
jgi:hypothetical protein